MQQPPTIVLSNDEHRWLADWQVDQWNLCWEVPTQIGDHAPGFEVEGSIGTLAKELLA